MTLAEMEELLANHDRLRQKYGGTSEPNHEIVATMLMPLDEEPHIQTPFGRCVLLEWRERAGQLEAVYALTRGQLAETIARIKQVQS